MVAVSSRDGRRAETYAEAHDIPRAHGSYDALLADGDVDAVYIALPNALHFEWTMRALAAGKHVLVEKPFTREPEQVDQAWEEAERRGLVIVEGYMWRHSPQTQLMLSLLPRLGELQAIHTWFFDPVLREHDVRFVSELGGGALLDLGCYCVGALRLVLGREPDDVDGVARLGRGGVDERFTGTLRFGELTATFACGFHGKTNTLEVLGSDGLLRMPHAYSDPDGVVLVNGFEHRAEPGGDYREQLADFCAAIRGERSPLVGREDTRGQAEALEPSCAPPQTAPNAPRVGSSVAAASHRGLVSETPAPAAELPASRPPATVDFRCQAPGFRWPTVAVGSLRRHRPKEVAGAGFGRTPVPGTGVRRRRATASCRGSAGPSDRRLA